jgi:hypothetical protein
LKDGGRRVCDSVIIIVPRVMALSEDAGGGRGRPKAHSQIETSSELGGDHSPMNNLSVPVIVLGAVCDTELAKERVTSWLRDALV